MAQHLLLISDADATCGVEEFTRLTARRMGERGATQILGGALQPSDDVVINLPIVAWKKRLLAPIGAAMRARAAGRQVTLILHEWADLAPARRVAYLPLLPLATRILFSAPEVMAQFDATPVARVVTKARRVVPIPPNFAVPEWLESTPLSESLAVDRARGKFVLAQFGSIYPRKDPMAVLDAAAELVRQGVDVRTVFIGSFVGDGVAAEFWTEVEALGLKGRVEVTGYIQSPAALYGIFAEVDAFLYPLSEGLTSRRASVLAAALSGRPVIVSAPQRSDSLAHHRLFRSLLAAGSLRLLPRDANASAMADAVLATRGAAAARLTPRSEIDAVWNELIATLDA